MIYLIDGVPRAGKSTLAKKLVEKNGIPFVSTDMVFNMLNDTIPEFNLIEPYAERHIKFFPFFKNLMKHVQNSVKDYVIEGDIFRRRKCMSSKRSTKFRRASLGSPRSLCKRSRSMWERMIGWATFQRPTCRISPTGLWKQVAVSKTNARSTRFLMSI
ncbi:MAG: hypothetical protein UT33_C0016G0003 [Candidatus Peregrinibacteria bacterium GW2011_GWC2_39_14]|nr:MAG: hypothetical protein UT33_C0016G0003 [Candidatus Peregrinibacteria bacterium GW2011_GWC2_39_14]